MRGDLGRAPSDLLAVRFLLALVRNVTYCKRCNPAPRSIQWSDFSSTSSKEIICSLSQRAATRSVM